MYMDNISGRKQENINSDRLWGEKCGDRGECDFPCAYNAFSV